MLSDSLIREGVKGTWLMRWARRLEVDDLDIDGDRGRVW